MIYKIALQNLSGIGLQKIDSFQTDIQRPSKRKTGSIIPNKLEYLNELRIYIRNL